MLQIITGEGKGKTTAAFGQALRALGRGRKVQVYQFLKSGDSGECMACEDFCLFPVTWLCKSEKFSWLLTEDEKEQLRRQTAAELAALDNLSCDLLVLDEIFAAVAGGFVPLAWLEAFLLKEKEKREIILTGRCVPDSVYALADYISNIQNERHPFEKGIPARKGVEY